jgi:ribosomal protein S18 acetylase RimI-like enzyme
MAFSYGVTYLQFRRHAACFQTKNMIPRGELPAVPDPVHPTYALRTVTQDDLTGVTALDEVITGISKPDYWQDLFERYGGRRRGRYFLLAEDQSKTLLGFIIGEVRAWEFGSPPCGWVFTLAVVPGIRQGGVGSALFAAICENFRKYGVNKVRTTVSRDNELVMSFFRSQGMMGSAYLQLEMDLTS